MNWTANWIAPLESMGDVCPAYVRQFTLSELPVSAILSVTAMGVYEARLNGQRISDYVLAPGWTSYEKRHQYQEYDVTALLGQENTLEILVGRGWYRSPIPWPWAPNELARWHVNEAPHLPAGLIAQLELQLPCGCRQQIVTDASWQARESHIRFSEIYDGESADMTLPEQPLRPVAVLDKGTENLIPQEGEIIRERTRVRPREILRTPKGELVVDFGQVVTGYVEFTVDAQKGDEVEISHAEVLDQEGNFYTDNYRTAKAKLRYTCREGLQTWKPRLTFFGFRYIRLDRFPGQPAPEQFTAIQVASDLRRTGRIRCGDSLVNRLFDNVLWGQLGNFLDVPTDCPQRDERLGWTGDAQVFVKAASYNFDVRKFFRKWLADMAADQHADGSIPHVVPDVLDKSGSAAWDDAATICPWQIYLTYADKEILSRQLPTMERYIGYITSATKDPYLWTGGTHYADWLGLDAPSGSYKGSSRPDFIASAFYAHSTALTAKAAGVLGLEEKAEHYRQLHSRILEAFRRAFPTYLTQTECVLALEFGLTEDRQATAALLAEKVISCGGHLQTGFVGTPYLLYALSRSGYAQLAYTLLLRREYPSWLYPVTRGATTIWEHWDGIMADGGFWSPDMNSFNHYAYGAVAAWIYEEAAGIHPVEEAPGFARVRFAPVTDPRLGWLEASIDTDYGTVSSGWYYDGGNFRHEITTPVPATVELGGRTWEVEPGSYTFFV